MKNTQVRFYIRLDTGKKKKKTGKLETTQSKNKEKDTKKINRASVSYGKSSLSLCICNWSILKDG